MSSLAFSPATLTALADVVTGGSGGGSGSVPIGIYRTGAKIEQFMMECNLDFRIGMSSRVSGVLGFLRTLAIEDPTKIKRVIERVAEPFDYIVDPELQFTVITHLNRFLSADGLKVVQGNPPQLIDLGRSGAVVSAIAAKVETIGFDTVQRDIERAMKSADDDPEDAVTAACSIIESVCRSILMDLGIGLPAKKDVDGLIKAVQEPLGLSPARTNLPNEIANDVRQVLGGLTNTAKGVGSLRTHAGDAHGREKGFKRIDGRIARLALHSASTLAIFLIETWEKDKQRLLMKRT